MTIVASGHYKLGELRLHCKYRFRRLLVSLTFKFFPDLPVRVDVYYFDETLDESLDEILN